MNLLHQSLSEFEEDEEEHAFVRAERREEIESSKKDNFLQSEMESHAIFALQASIEEPGPLAKRWQNTMLHINGMCTLWYAGPLYSTFSVTSCPGFAVAM